MTFPLLSINSMPDLNLDLPLDEKHERSIISSATRVSSDMDDQSAPISRVWQLPPACFSINNTRWSEHMKALVNQLKDELGCAKMAKVTYNLDKLLLCEPGGFLKVGT